MTKQKITFTVKNKNEAGPLELTVEKNNKDEIANALNETEEVVKNSSDQDLKKEKEEAENKLGEIGGKEELRNIIKREVEKMLQQFGIKAVNLSSESQDKLGELNNNIEPDQAKNIRNDVLNEGGEKVLSKLISELNQAIEAHKDKKEIENKTKKLEQFINDKSNEYAQNAYTRKKDAVQQLLARAKDQSSQNKQNNDNEEFFRLNNPVMWLSGVAVVGLVVGVMLIIRSRRKNLTAK